MIKARMLNGVSWHDICILNCSAHGLGIQSADPPARGSYVEIRRGPHTIIARVAWRNGHRAGLTAQDLIFVSALIGGNDATPTIPAAGADAFVERRRQQRTAALSHSNNRLAARAMEFASFGIIAFAVGVAAFSAVAHVLTRPMQAVETALR